MVLGLLLAALMGSAYAARSAKKPAIPIEYYDLNELTLVRMHVAGNKRYVIFRDLRGIQHRLHEGSMLATHFLHVVSITTDYVSVGPLTPCPDGPDWCMVPLYELRPGEDRRDIVPPAWYVEELAQKTSTENWPLTLADAVRIFISQLTERDKATLRKLAQDDLTSLHFAAELNIRNDLGLWAGNNKLLLSTCKVPCHPDTASAMILNAVWVELRKSR